MWDPTYLAYNRNGFTKHILIVRLPGLIISAPIPVASTLKTVCFVVMVMLEYTVHSKSPAGPQLTT